MRFVFRFRYVSALLILACLFANIIWMPTTLSWEQILNGAEAWSLPINLGQAHVAIYVAMLVTMLVFALALLLMPSYSKMLARLTMFCVMLCLVLSVSFRFVFPAMWLLPLWASWRLSGSPKLRWPSDTP